MIPAFESLFNCLINGYMRYHLNTMFVPYSKTTLARQLQEKCQEQNVDIYMTFVDNFKKRSRTLSTSPKHSALPDVTDFESHMFRFIF